MKSGITLAGAAWSWVGASLTESVAIYRAIGVRAIDLIAIPGKPLDTYEIARDPLRHADLIRRLEVELSNLLVFFGGDFRDRAINSIDASVCQTNLETFKRLLEFCVAAGCYSVTVLPGVDQSGCTRESVLEHTANVLNRMNGLAKAAGVLLVYEPHVESVLEQPDHILEFAQKNPELKLVIDYSHAISLGYSTVEMDKLVPFAGHVHLRQAAQGKIQARWEDGRIDFPALLRLLRQSGYHGYATLEYEHDPFWDMDQCDVMTETIKMRDAVLPVIS